MTETAIAPESSTPPKETFRILTRRRQRIHYAAAGSMLISHRLPTAIITASNLPSTGQRRHRCAG